MKKLITFFVLLFLSTINSFSQSSCIPTNTCTLVGEPYVYYLPSVFSYGLLDRYLSRSIGMFSMQEQRNTPDYCQNINLLTRLKPEFIFGIAGSWGGDENQIIPGGSYYTNSQLTIQDIRKLYCSLGLRMPIFDAGIFEAVTSKVNNVTIPAYVHADFQNDADYIAAGYNINPPVNFDISYIKNGFYSPWWTNPPQPTDCYTPDLTRVQAKMWFYYLATSYIDMGCNSINLGWFERSFHNDAPLYLNAYDLCQKIRTYAQNKGTFVIISGDVGKAIYYNNTNNLIFDFVNCPIRPEPTHNQYGNSVHSTPCDKNYMTELDFNKYHCELMNDHGGISPFGAFIEHMPKLFNFDWYGINYTGSYPPQPINMGNGYSPWGVNETVWFYNLEPKCQAYFLKNIAYAIKNDIGNRSYLKMPGQNDLTWWGYTVHQYQMYKIPDVIDAVEKNIYSINEDVYFTITLKCETNCNNELVHKYILKVTNPDVSSIYKFHVYNQTTNTWLPFTYGNERILENLQNGTYLIGLRQDNIGLPYYHDTYALDKELVVTDASYFCCNDNERSGGEKNGGVSQKIDSSVYQLNKTTINNIKVFPSPTKDKLNIQFYADKPDNVSIFISDLTGNIIKNIGTNTNFESGNNSVTTDVSDIANGLYFVNFVAKS